MADNNQIVTTDNNSGGSNALASWNDLAVSSLIDNVLPGYSDILKYDKFTKLALSVVRKIKQARALGKPLPEDLIVLDMKYVEPYDDVKQSIAKLREVFRKADLEERERKTAMKYVNKINSVADADWGNVLDLNPDAEFKEEA